jgi:hypothetical protein
MAAIRAGIIPLFGIEMNSMEEVHLLAIFGAPSDALDFGAFLWDRLPEFHWDPGKLGTQVVVDADEIVLDEPPRYFGAALDMGFDELAAQASKRGALVIPAHVDRLSYSVGSQLGFLPDGPFDAVEAVRPPVEPFLDGGHTVITDSDAHFPQHIGRRSFGLEMPDKSLADYRDAISRCMLGTASGSGLEPEIRRLWPHDEAREFLESVRAAIRAGLVDLGAFNRPSERKSE